QAPLPKDPITVMTSIEYRLNAPLTLAEFIELYRASTLAERRPAGDADVMQQMMENANLTISAWDGARLVGISRCLTDHAYVAYLSDLAVAKSHQGRGLGRQLIAETKRALGKGCSIVLFAAPAGDDFYPRVGFTRNAKGWVLPGDAKVR
ncbi:MAG: putative N-acetyltransferase YhbS, partial [Gammaproteobacteria bacterium]